MKHYISSKKHITLAGLILFASVIIFINGCKKESGTFTVLLTDAPGSYQEVNVEILTVKVHVDAAKNKKAGWYDLTTNTGIYDLIKLQNNVTATLAVGEELPAGDITQISLMLGTNNTVKDSTGQIYSMTVPSGTETGIKIVGRQLVKNEDGNITLDFDASMSVTYSGTSYVLNPVITVK